MGHWVAGVRPKVGLCWINLRRGCLGMEGPSMLEGVVEEIGSKDHLKASLVISTFPHSLWMWPGSGSKQRRGNVVQPES